MNNSDPSSHFEYYSHKLQARPDHASRIVTHPTPQQLQAVTRIYIMGICGKAMACLAQLLSQAGYTVGGSDICFFPPMDAVLSRLKLKVYSQYSRHNIIDFQPDLVVVGNTIHPSNEETAYAREHNIPQISVVAALKHFVMTGRKVIGVAGTHGKTTTTGLLVHVLNGCGAGAGYLVGGVDVSTGKCSDLGAGEYFIIEADEFGTAYFDVAPKFLGYGVTHAIVTSMEPDHMTYFSDWEDYQQAFRFYVQALPADGVLVAYGDSEAVLKACQSKKDNYFKYFLDSEHDPSSKIPQYTIKNIKKQGELNTAQIHFNNNKVATLKTPLFGSYNLLNCLSVFTMAINLGFPAQQVLQQISTFQGMQLRQQIFFDSQYQGMHITLVMDYAHHHTALLQTYRGQQAKFPGRRVVAVYEFSSSNSTIRAVEDSYKQILPKLDRVVMKNLPPGEEKLRVQDLVVYTNQVRGEECAFSFHNAKGIADFLLESLRDGDVLLVMTARNFDGLIDDLLSVFEGRKHTTQQK